MIEPDGDLTLESLRIRIALGLEEIVFLSHMTRASDGFIIVIHDGHHQDARAPRQYAVDTTARLVPALTPRPLIAGGPT